MNTVRIKEVEDLVGITRKNIRFYEKEGLLQPGRELENSYRDYSEDDIRRLRIIKLLRKLDMPISSISDVLEHRISLREALHLHELLLEEQRGSIVNAQRVCGLIAAEGAELSGLDTERYLAELERTEENGAALVDLRRRDSAGKYTEQLIVSSVVVSVMLLVAAVLLLFIRSGRIPAALPAFFAAVIFVVIFGIFFALRARLKEIRAAEDDHPAAR